jgi:hypothetical protein
LWFVSLVFFLVLPSTALLQEHLGWWGIAAHLLLVSFVLASVVALWPRLYSLVAGRYWLLLGILVLGLAAVFAVVYPLETAGRFSLGSDRDEALNIAARRLLAGEYPYYERTHLGGAITPLPGAILLSLPFVLLGNSAYQNLFWLLVFLYATTRYLEDRASALVLFYLALALSPAIQYEFISGGDVLSNAIYVTVLAFLVMRAYAAGVGARAWQVGGCLLLGLGLASRPNFFLLLPLLFALLWRQSGLRAALAGCGLAALASLAVILPFYLYDPGRFSPLTAGNKLAVFDRSLPYASLAVVVLSLVASFLVAFFLGRTSSPEREPLFYYGLAIVQLVPILGAVILASAINGRLDLGFLHDRYGLMFLIPGLWSCWWCFYGPELPHFAGRLALVPAWVRQDDGRPPPRSR